MTEEAYPSTVRETIARVDGAWREFHALAAAYPAERMDEHLSERGWTRKQMLAHIAAWHDLTTERLGKLIDTGKKQDLAEKEDVINARVARRAVGRTAGEVVGDMEATFNRLRRQVTRLTDEQLALHEHWAAAVIAGNTYQHYAEHRPDVTPPPPPEAAA